MALSLKALAMLAGIQPADLSQVDDPAGRVDFLASKVIENGVAQLGGEIPVEVVAALQATYRAARPLIDGLLVKHLGMIRIPEESLKVLPEVIKMLPNSGRKAS